MYRALNYGEKMTSSCFLKAPYVTLRNVCLGSLTVRLAICLAAMAVGQFTVTEMHTAGSWGF